MPRHLRNAGFWTDKRLFQAEGLFAAAALCGPWTLGLLLISADRPLWAGMLVMFAYPLAIYLLMRGMNMDEPQ
ncbi:hypothetical protein SAQ01S_07020 [Sphingomonas aquatilis NBRC 16722]|nr:hypothetical protein SAQ01S_07020 [Sphingomonas aquatilis NBRC 16722]